MSESSTAKNLKRIAESVEQHDANCKVKAKAVCLNPYELDRLGFDSITTKSGRKVPIKPDDSLGTGRLRVVCDGYHGPKKEKEQEETVEAPAPAERELVPAGGRPTDEEGRPWPHRGGPKGDADKILGLIGFEMTPWQRSFWDVASDPEGDLEAWCRQAFQQRGRR